MTALRAPATTLDELRSCSYVLQQRICYEYTAPLDNLRQRLRVVPPEAHGRQRRRSWSLEVAGVQSSTKSTFVDRFGNVTVDVEIPRVEQAVEFVLDVEADLDSSATDYENKADRSYRRATRLTAPDEATTELAEGVHVHDLEALCTKVHRSIAYEWGVTGVRTTAEEALTGGRGVCQDYAHIMITACRIAGLPARYVSGHLVGAGGTHAWVEVLRPNGGPPGTWIAEGWDPTHDRRADAGYLVVAVGRDYADAAPLSGTYDGDRSTNTLTVNKRLDFA